MVTEREAPATAPSTAAAAGRLALRGAGLLMLRQGLVSLATLGGVLALSALLSPSQFALYGYATTVMLVAAAVGDLGLGASLIRADELKPEHLRGSLALQLAFWIPFCLLGFAAGSALHVYGFSTTTTALLLAALFLFSLQALPIALLERRVRFGAIAGVEVIQRALFVVVAVALAVGAPAQWSIPLAALAAAAVSYPAVLILSRWHWGPRFHRGEPLFKGFSSQWFQSRLANQLAYAAYPLLGGILFSAHEVGLLVWALAVTSIPALMAPMVARAAFPVLSRTEPEHQVEVFRPLFKSLLLVGLPMVVALLTCAHPLTQYVLGEKWLEGVSVLRLESITTMFGLVLTPLVPFLFLIAPPRQVKWIMVGWTGTIVVLSPLLAPIFSFRAISVAQIVAVVWVFLVVRHLLHTKRSYGLLRELRPGLASFALATAVGIPLAAAAHGTVAALAAAAAIAAVQLAGNVLLGGGVDPRVLLRQAGTRDDQALTAVTR
jgi:polysaccharide transporter, PST family